MDRAFQRLLRIELPPRRSAFLWGPRKIGAGGTCEFSAQTLRSDRRGAHVAPASARASGRLLLVPESHERDDANREDTQVENLCYGGQRTTTG